MLKILQIKDRCTGCGSCANICPARALKMDYDEEGFYFPVIDETKCIQCNLCESKCHVISKKFIPAYDKDARFYMASAVSDKLLEESSSGGIFSLLAERTLEEGGIVYGAKYNYKEEKLEHVSTDDFSLSELRKSKYVESYTGKIFTDIRQNLETGRKVLFCGTPCQIRGLKTFLEKETDNLILVELVCHGVPSNKHFSDYKRYLEKLHRSKIVKLNFRFKQYGWSKLYLSLGFGNKKNIIKFHKKSLYYTAFLNNTFLRRSCYECNYLSEKNSDIALADFWGIKKYKPEYNGEKGLSLVLINTEKGKHLFESINPAFFTSEPLPPEAVNYVYADKNRTYSHYRYQRERIGKGIRKYGYVRAMKKLHGKEVLKTIVKSLLGRSI